MKIVLDIETLQATRSDWARLMGLPFSASGSSGPDSGDDLFSFADQEEQKKKEDDQYQRSAFDGTFSRIVTIGVLIFSDAMVPQEAIAWYGDDEGQILRQFWNRLGKTRPSLIITHNGLGFDLPFIKKRSIIHGVKPPFEISLAKFRTEPVFDTMAVWSNWDMRGWVKLDVLARALGVETKSGSGAQVGEMWEKQPKKDVAEYCLQDTYVTYACYARMTYQELCSRDQVLATPRLIDVDKS